jgi:tetratricopeptide (TPR) repeat protein
LHTTPGAIAEYAVLIPAYLISGWTVLTSAGRNILRGQIFDENFLMTIATLGAIAIHELPEGVAVMLFFQIGELFQGFAVGRSRRSIKSLLEVRPDKANLIIDGVIREVAPEKSPLRLGLAKYSFLLATIARPNNPHQFRRVQLGRKTTLIESLMHPLLSLPRKLSLVNPKPIQLRLLIFKLIFLNGIIGGMLPVNAHSANETLEPWQADLELNQLLNQGKELLDRGKLAEALSAYQHAASLERENPRVFSAIGYLQAVQANFPAAADAFQKAIALESDNAYFYYGLAYSLASSKAYAEAANAYNQTIKLDPNLVNAHLGLAVVLLRQQNYNGALDAFLRVTTLAPDNLFAYRTMGTIFLQKKQFTKAIEALQRAAELAPSESAIQLDIAIAWLNLNNIPKAIAAFERAAKLNPEDGEIHFQIGRILQLSCSGSWSISCSPTIWQASAALRSI